MLGQIESPGGGHRLVHHQADGKCIGNAPLAGFVPENRKLNRQFAGRLLDKIIHAPRISGKHPAIGIAQLLLLRRGNAPNSVLPGFAIIFQGSRSHNFSQFSKGCPAKVIHLPKAVLRSGVSLREEGVVQACRFDVRDPFGVSFDGDPVTSNRKNGATGFRQRPPHNPVKKNAQHHKAGGDGIINVFKKPV